MHLGGLQRLHRVPDLVAVGAAPHTAASDRPDLTVGAAPHTAASDATTAVAPTLHLALAAATSPAATLPSAALAAPVQRQRQ